MGSNQKKAAQRRSTPSWLLGCFGFTRSEAKKGRKSSGGRRLIRLCLPKMRVLSIRRKKVGLDAKAAALKATQTIMLEASKVQQLKLHKHNHHNPALSTTQDQLKLLPKEKEVLQLDNKVQTDQSDDIKCHKQGQKFKTKQTCGVSNVTNDSLIGVSIMLTTLVIMGIWGKLCAILCMSAWFYCVPLLRADRNFRDVPTIDGTKLDVDSEQCKKKVVLQGLLQRDHKPTSGAS